VAAVARAEVAEARAVSAEAQEHAALKELETFSNLYKNCTFMKMFCEAVDRSTFPRLFAAVKP
jgi:hypothetical protein